MRRFCSDSTRRSIGAVFLTVAVAMMVTGDVFLGESLGAFEYLLFWSTCFLFTVLSIFVAVLDALAVFKQSLLHRRQLFNATVRDVEKWTGEPIPVRFSSVK